jgi:hypothetical protein
MEAMPHQHVADYLFRNGGGLFQIAVLVPHRPTRIFCIISITNRNNFSKAFWGTP